jgi:hypothetical protein
LFAALTQLIEYIIRAYLDSSESARFTALAIAMGQKQSSRKPQGSYLEAFVAIKKFPTLISKFEVVYGDVQRVKRAIPKLVTTARFAGSLGAYYALIGTTGVVLQWIHIQQTYQLTDAVKRIAVAQEAMVALEVPIKFAQYVYDKVEYEIDTTAQLPGGNKNIYFVFNPDNKWYPEFSKLNKRKPLGDQFCGFSDDLPAMCLWMRFVRILLRVAKGKHSGQVPHGEEIFHLIIPTYSLVRYEAPMKFSEEIHPLIIHGDVLFGKKFVQLNLPDAHPAMLDRVENLYKEPGWFESWLRPNQSFLGRSQRWLTGQQERRWVHEAIAGGASQDSGARKKRV